MTNKYLLDANTFMQAKDREYRFDFAIAFWDWLKAAHHHGLLYSTQRVRSEIERGSTSCPLRVWSKSLPQGFFLNDLKDARVMKHYATVIAWAHGQSQFTEKAVLDFADQNKADAFLIATAKARGMTVVTHEGTSENSKARVLVPHAAKCNGVRTLSLYNLLSLHATATFQFKP